MKFGESLSEGLVPEWKDQYVHYNLGKKRIRSIGLLSDQLASQEATDTTPLLSPVAAFGPQNPCGLADHYTESHGAYSKGQEGIGDSHISEPDESHKGPTPRNAVKYQNRGSVKGSVKSLFRHFSGKSLDEAFKDEKCEFLHWLDTELRMVDKYYMEKEKNIYARFLILEDQFFQLKEHKAAFASVSKQVAKTAQAQHMLDAVNVQISRWTFNLKAILQSLAWCDLPSMPSMAFFDSFRRTKRTNDVQLKANEVSFYAEFDPHFRENQVRNGEVGLDTDPDDALEGSLGSVPSGAGENADLYAGPRHLDLLEVVRQQKQARKKDYVTLKRFGVPYFYARNCLKDALVEHYRAIALVRSYRTMNRTALRKITKKFDKATGCTVSGDFMKKIDKNSYFQTTEMLDQVLTRVEDLFLTFFDTEKAGRKHALDRLRSATYAYNNADVRGHSYYRATFASGLCAGIALPFFGIALYVALQHTLLSRNTLFEGPLEDRFLLQIWGGFLLINVCLFLVGITYIVFTHFKINYKFIYEFDPASALDFRQFFLLPSLGFALLCACAWLLFLDFWPNKLPGRVWPLIYLGCVLTIFLWPGLQLYVHSRRWMQVTLWRILCSGLYPVEFRDFYLGDILCSLTYSVSNLSFFICLYAGAWSRILGSAAPVPRSSVRCGSGYSRLMGFLAALPSIWRFLQCVRRYMDTGDAFPHLANMAKYVVSAAYYCLLSVWRIDRSASARAAFITLACIYSLFAASWDIIMDWLLGLASSKHFLLRDHLFFENPIYYYAAMVLDVVLRFQWIFYAFFSTQLQQLAVTSFCIAVAELTRRFVWMFFRMENEHCANVVVFRASRESPLPYLVSAKVEKAINKLVDLRYAAREKASEDDVFLSYHVQSTPPASLNVSSKDPSKPALNVPVKGSQQGVSTAYRAPGIIRTDEDEASVDRPSLEPLHGALSRRKSTLAAITNALNKAHIKDFQRRKYAVRVDDSGDDEDDMEDEAGEPFQEENPREG